MLYGSLFGQSTAEARYDNWTSYLDFIRKGSGELLEEDKDLTHKRELLKQLSEPAVRTRQPLASTEAFYRNCDKLRDDLQSLDKKTLTLTCIYKFARHEWAGIEAAWNAVPPLDQCRDVRSRIARYHLAEEFCHLRLFGEMFKTCHLDRVEWIPMPHLMRWFYAAIARFPYAILGAPALASELMGVSFYFHLKLLLNEVFADEPEALAQLQRLLEVIILDELSHIGQRRNYLGSAAIRVVRRLLSPMIRSYFADIPESKLLFNIDKMVQDARQFDYNFLSPRFLERIWIPSYIVAARTV
ncbi:MAG TPA: hypothetical protein VGH22_01595 [Candidatus Binatia bacterium]|jgi:hypothetical protein